MAARRITSTEATAPTSLPRRGQGSPFALILLGLLLLVFAGLVITLQTQTNEAYVNGTQHVDNIIQAQWTIWLQIPKLMFGSNIPGPDVKPDDLVGIILGQGVELVYLALIAGLQITMHTSSRLGRLIGTIVLIFLFVIAVFNFYTDLVYGNVSPVAHVAFALFCTLVAGFFPTWGLTLIQHGWKRS